jgi:hypothetical protein
MGKLGQTGTHGFCASAGIIAFCFVEQRAAFVARASCPLNAVVEGGSYATLLTIVGSAGARLFACSVLWWS